MILGLIVGAVAVAFFYTQHTAQAATTGVQVLPINSGVSAPPIQIIQAPASPASPASPIAPTPIPSPIRLSAPMPHPNYLMARPIPYSGGYGGGGTARSYARL